MGILSSVAVQKWSGAVEQSRFDATRRELRDLADAMAGNPELTAHGVRTDFGYVGDVGALPPNLDALVTNPGGYATWDGPYIQNNFAGDSTDFKEDAWGVAYAYGGTTITSNGSGTPFTETVTSAAAHLTSNSLLGSVTDGLDNSPGNSALSVRISITYPDGAGSYTMATTHPNTGGSYGFSGCLPVGNHAVTAIYQTDTLVRYLSVLPNSTAYVNFRMPGDLWSPAGGRGGDGGSGLTYTPGSAADHSSGQDMSFDVTNGNGSTVSLTSISTSYASAIYYEQILIGGTSVFNRTSPRGTSGGVESFAAVDINDGATVTIRFNRFQLCSSGGCGNGDTRGESFIVGFSDGSSVRFTVPWYE